MFKKSLSVALGLGAVIGASQAQSITFQGVGLAGTADISYNGGGAEWVYAGYLNFTGGHSLGFVNDSFSAICGDVLDNISTGMTYPGVAWDSQAYAAVSGNQGIARAGNIIAKDFFAAQGSAAKAEGLQLAVWETLYDNDLSTPDFANNIFRAAGHGSAFGAGLGSASNPGDVLYYATQYFADRTIVGHAAFIKAGPESGGQDQFTMQELQGGHHLVTPEPFTMTLGFAGIGLFLRRRAKRS